MFEFLKRVFASLGSGANRISDKRQILKIFIQLCDHHSNLTLQFNDQKKSQDNYTTNVVAIHPGEKRVVLDELIPREGNLLVGKKAECTLKVLSAGKFYQFQAVLNPVVGEKPPCYTIELPALIELSQKRQAYRLAISRVQTTGVMLNTANREPLSGRILDISATGARVELQASVSPPFKSGDNIEKCTLTLPDKVRITCKAEIRHWETDRSRRSTIVGLKFLTISPNDQRMVTRFIHEMQRKMLKISHDSHTGSNN